MTYLVLRFSTLGNVAMTVPVIASVSAMHPDDEFIVVAKKRLSAMYYGLPNVRFHEAEPPSIRSLVRLYHDLRQYSVDVVIDLQKVPCTWFLRVLFRLGGSRTYSVDYGRWTKHLITVCGFRLSKSLPTEFERYQAAFRKAGLESDDRFTALAVNEPAREAVMEQFGEKHGKWIGIAPFAKSRSNMLPYKVTKEVIARLSENADTRLFLFGAGQIECEMLRQWASVFPRTTSVAGRLPLEQELELMRRLDCMVCMDSANQHLSSLVGLRAISVWCATHPELGFMGWKQHKEDIVQLDRIACRPCTCHGTNTCRYRNFACRDINAEQIIKRIYE